MSYLDKTIIKIAVVEDHTMLREAICSLINDWDNCKVILQAGNGVEFMALLDSKNLPDLALIDLAMPQMNGYDTIKIVKTIHPNIKFLVVSMYQSEDSIMLMLKSGADGFIKKNSDCTLLKKAVFEITRTGYYFSDQVTARIVKQAIEKEKYSLINNLSEKELIFLRHAVSEKTYPQIAKEMSIPPRQVEYLRKTLFEKFDVQSRTALAVHCIKEGIVL